VAKSRIPPEFIACLACGRVHEIRDAETVSEESLWIACAGGCPWQRSFDACEPPVPVEGIDVLVMPEGLPFFLDDDFSSVTGEALEEALAFAGILRTPLRWP
jgi:hypothetical protein